MAMCVIFLLLSAIVLTSGQQGNVSCLLFRLHDSFGDGWGDASLLLESPDGSIMSIAPDCTQNPKITERCFYDDGVYFLTVTSTSSDEIPKNSWEIYWSVGTWGIIEKIYAGGFNTTMALQYTIDWGWRLIYWDNLWTGLPNALTCGFNNAEYEFSNECHTNISHSHIKGKMKEHKKSKSIPIPIHTDHLIGRRGGTGYQEHPDTAMTMTTRKLQSSKILQYHHQHHQFTSGSVPSDEYPLKQLQDKASALTRDRYMTRFLKVMNANNISEVAVRRSADYNMIQKNHDIKTKYERIKSKLYDKRIVRKQGTNLASLKVIMQDSSTEQQWTKGNYETVSFQISDDTKTTLVAYGSLAKGIYSGFCEYCFQEGSYYFRLTNDRIINPDADWSFCNTKGSPLQELAFHIKDGICYPDVLIDIQTICMKEQYSLITVEGNIAIDGLSSEIFGLTEARIIAQALASEVYGWNADTMDVRATTINPFLVSTGSTSTSTSTSIDTSRKLSSFSYEINFKSSFVTELAYQIDGTNYNLVQDLMDVLQSEVYSITKSGRLLASIKGFAIAEEVSTFNYITAVNFKSFDMEEMAHVGAADMDITIDDNNEITTNQNLDETEDYYIEAETNEEDIVKRFEQENNVRYVYIPNANPLAFLAVLSLGVMALIGLMTKAMSRSSAVKRQIDLEQGSDGSSSSSSGKDRGEGIVTEEFEGEMDIFPSEKEPTPQNFLRKEIPESRKTVVL